MGERAYLCNKSKPSSLKREANRLRKLLTGLLVKVAFLTNGNSLYPGQMLSLGVPSSCNNSLLFVMPDSWRDRSGRGGGERVPWKFCWFDPIQLYPEEWLPLWPTRRRCSRPTRRRSASSILWRRARVRARGTTEWQRPKCTIWAAIRILGPVRNRPLSKHPCGSAANWTSSSRGEGSSYRADEPQHAAAAAKDTWLPLRTEPMIKCYPTCYNDGTAV